MLEAKIYKGITLPALLLLDDSKLLTPPFLAPLVYSPSHLSVPPPLVIT